METKELTLVSFWGSSDHIYGLDTEGKMWYRSKVPFNYTSYTYTNRDALKEQEKKKEEALWKPLEMTAIVPQPPLPEPKEIVAGEPEPITIQKIEPKTTPEPCYMTL